MSRRDRATVLLSGGLDSTTALSMAVNKYGADNVIAISSVYGQRHSKEINHAIKIAEHYKVKHIVVDLGVIMQYSDNALMNRSEKELPTGKYADQPKKGPISTYVPYRNGLFLSAASAISLSIFKDPKELIHLYYGAHRDDSARSAYPDTSKGFNRAQARAIYTGSGKRIKLESPFIKLTKAEIVAIGLKLKTPYEMTWSCYQGGVRACGICNTCTDRMEAFRQNGIKDPIKYFTDR